MKAKISDIYTYANINNQNLFGDVSGFDFMAGYAANRSAFDFLFNKKFSTFFYFSDFNKNTPIADVYTDFSRAVNAFLLFNSKRYSELYRVEILAANAYDIVNNYDLTETSTRTNSGSNTLQRSARTDSDVLGARSSSDVYGSREDETTVENGVQVSNTQKDIAGFNSPTYVSDDKTTTTINANTSGGTTVKGQQTDTHSQQSVTDTHNVGQQTETGSNTGSESVNLRRYGNIGVQTAAEIIGGHIELWNAFNFYEIIFREIAAEFLLVDDDFTSDNDAGVFSQADIQEILDGINEIKAQITASTSAIQNDIDDVRIDITDVQTDIHSAEAAIKANDNTNTATIRADIAGVVSNGY